MTDRHLHCAAQQPGDTLIEVLVTLLIIMIGVLSLVGLQVHVQQSELEAYQRAQGLVLIEDMVSRLTANRTAAPCYAITTSGGTPYFGSGVAGGGFSCSGYGDPTAQARAVADMEDWNLMLQGESVKHGVLAAGAMTGARGCITLTDSANNIFTIAIAWQGFADIAVPAVNCANNLYGVEARRRVVWTTIRLATLNAP